MSIGGLSSKRHLRTHYNLGENVEINDYVHIAAGEKIIIGNHVLIASKVFISDLNHGNYMESDLKFGKKYIKALRSAIEESFHN